MKIDLLAITGSDSETARIDVDVPELSLEVANNRQVPQFGRSKAIKLA